MGRASNRKKGRRIERAREKDAAEHISRPISQDDLDFELARQALRELTDNLRRTRLRRAEVIARWWDGEPRDVALPHWPEDSLGERLFSEPLERALAVPPLREAVVPDPATIVYEPEQWEVAAWVLVRAVVVDGLGVDHSSVEALVRTLTPVAVAELTASEVAAGEAASEGLPRGAIAPAHCDEDGPVFVVGCLGLVHALWTAIGEDPASQVLEVLSALADEVLPGHGRVAAGVLVNAFADHYLCEGPGDAELLQSLVRETSGNPLTDLVSAGLVAPDDALQVGLELLSRLAELCKTDAVSVLDRAAPQPAV